MKVQIRQGVFETNSSSTHSLAIISKKHSDALDSGDVYITTDFEILTKEQVELEWDVYQKTNGNHWYQSKDEFRKRSLDAFTMQEFEEWCNDRGYELLWEATPDKKWVAVSLWGDRS